MHPITHVDILDKDWLLSVVYATSCCARTMTVWGALGPRLWDHKMRGISLETREVCHFQC
jgi:hypothetical protein